jgi:SAM-dependent methyltransferase
MPEPRHLQLGRPTGRSARHRIDKLHRLGIVHGRWLDIGCGDGDYTRELVAHGCTDVVGVDVRHSDAWQRIAAGFAVASGQRLPFAEGSFDGVLLNEVLEHVSDEHAVLSDIRRVLRPGGLLALYSPNRWFPFEGHGAIVGGRSWDFPVPLLPWLPERIATRFLRARNYWPGQLRRTVEGVGFRVIAMEFAYPLFVEYRWLPPRMAGFVRRVAPTLEETPVLRRLGVSTLIVART